MSLADLGTEGRYYIIFFFLTSLYMIYLLYASIAYYYLLLSLNSFALFSLLASIIAFI